MNETSLRQQAILWGQAYEILTKRGALDYLIEKQMIDIESPWLEPWRTHTLPNVSAAIISALELVDPDVSDRVTAAVEHMALTSFGTGYTLMRHYIDTIKSSIRQFSQEKLTAKALWCPLTMPALPDAEPSKVRREKLIQALTDAFGLRGVPDPQWAGTGKPANADFMLWLDYDGKQTFLLVQEYSYDSPGELADFQNPEAHLRELKRFRKISDMRSVFARIAAEVEHEHFKLDKEIWQYLLAFSGKDKPLYKLCQASSYATSMATVLQDRAGVTGIIKACALAITPNGVDSLSAHIGGGDKDPRLELMREMAEAYQNAESMPDNKDNNKNALMEEVKKAFSATVSKLPKSLRPVMKDMRDQIPEPGQDYEFSFTEQMTDFCNLDKTFSLEEAVDLIPSSDAINDYFGGDTKAILSQEMSAFLERQRKLTLRDIHAAAVVAGLKRAQPGKLNLIALEGNPGIGKTTAVREYLLSQNTGFLFIYLSPRVVINRDVASSMAMVNGQPSGILTLTTNARLINTADSWYKKMAAEGKMTPKKIKDIKGAVVADGVPNLVHPEGAILVLTPDQERELNNYYTSKKFKKKPISEYEEHVQDSDRFGVMMTLSLTTRDLIKLNPEVNRLALTMALQGFKERADYKTTVDSLSNIFVNQSKINIIARLNERKDFARKIPNIVVMVDELTGDGVGASFVHEIAKWLLEEFLYPFKNEPSPFTVILIASDASLGNKVVFERYLNAGTRTPDKILVSRSRGKHPFDLAVNEVALNSQKVKCLHVMTNSFPAKQLTLRYSVRLKNVQPEFIDKGRHAGRMQTINEAIKKYNFEAVRASALTEIMNARNAKASQIICFVQNKRALREIQNTLIKHDIFSEDEIERLDSSEEGYERKRRISPDVRDRKRVFLMTASGSRGISFPKADWIIACFPRFAIETQLMEIAQLIYRGRGKSKDEYGNEINGDDVHRTLVFTIDDFNPFEETVDERQWLMHSLNLMTLLIMLRSTVFTRITGDAGLRQPLALVPVGATKMENVANTMSQEVNDFLSEAEIFMRERVSDDLKALVYSAQKNIHTIFRKTDFEAIFGREKKKSYKTESDKKESYISKDVADRIQKFAKSKGVGPLIQHRTDNSPLLPPDTIFWGPVVIENGAKFEKVREILVSEEHNPVIRAAKEKLKTQLYHITQNTLFPKLLRDPAQALFDLLDEEEHDEANEFHTIKNLRAPNTWIVVPAEYQLWSAKKQSGEGNGLPTEDAYEWHKQLAATLGTGQLIPALPEYHSFPWAVSVGGASPLNLDVVFDDRYFMVSNELNLLNTLLLGQTQADKN